MSNRKRQLATPQELLTLMDEYLTALYRHHHDPQRPPELPDRISRYCSPSDLSNAR